MGRWEGRRDRGKQQLRDRQPRQVTERQADNWRESFPSRGFVLLFQLVSGSPQSLGGKRVMVFLSLGSLLQILILPLPEELVEGESSLPNCINAPDEHRYPDPNLNVVLLRINNAI